MNYKPLPQYIRKKRAKILVDAIISKGFNFVTGVPCAVQKFIIREFLKRNIFHVPATREDEAMGIATGAYLSGKKPVVYMQNSGFFNSLHTFNSLLITYRIPILMLVTWRGAPGENAVHHLIDGKITKFVFKKINVPFSIPNNEKDITKSLEGIVLKMKNKNLPGILLIKRGVF